VASDYTIRESRRTKHVRLKVSLYDASLVVTVPHGFDRREIASILAEKRQWIERMQKRVIEQREEFDPEPAHSLPDQIPLRAVGEQWTASYGPTPRRRSVEINRQDLRLVVSEDLAGDEVWRPLLRMWLSQQARHHLVPWLRALSEQHDLPFERVLIKGQCTCWSSCSRKKTISVNYKLLFLPPGLVRYVLIHELCHTAQLDHSPKFWKLVHAHEPRCRILDRELNAAWRYVPAWVDRGS